MTYYAGNSRDPQPDRRNQRGSNTYQQQQQQQQQQQYQSNKNSAYRRQSAEPYSRAADSYDRPPYASSMNNRTNYDDTGSNDNYNNNNNNNNNDNSNSYFHQRDTSYRSRPYSTSSQNARPRSNQGFNPKISKTKMFYFIKCSFFCIHVQFKLFNLNQETVGSNGYSPSNQSMPFASIPSLMGSSSSQFYDNNNSNSNSNIDPMTMMNFDNRKRFAYNSPQSYASNNNNSSNINNQNSNYNYRPPMAEESYNNLNDQHENSAAGVSVKMRGLPFHINEQQVREFFHPLMPSVVNILIGRDQRPTGECECFFSTTQEAYEAMKYDKKYIGWCLQTF